MNYPKCPFCGKELQLDSYLYHLVCTTKECWSTRGLAGNERMWETLAMYKKQTEIYQGATNDLYDNYDLDDAQCDLLDKMMDDALKCLNEYKAKEQ